MMAGHIWSFLISWRIGAQNFFQSIFIIYLKFCFFHSFCILSHGQCINHGLNISAEETLQVVSGIADAMICHASLGEIVGADFS